MPYAICLICQAISTTTFRNQGMLAATATPAAEALRPPPAKTKTRACACACASPASAMPTSAFAHLHLVSVSSCSRGLFFWYSALDLKQTRGVLLLAIKRKGHARAPLRRSLRAQVALRRLRRFGCSLARCHLQSRCAQPPCEVQQQGASTALQRGSTNQARPPGGVRSTGRRKGISCFFHSWVSHFPLPCGPTARRN
jgi:hypothetical protein